MATAVLFRAALQRLSFTNDAATYIVDTQGFDAVDDYKILTDAEADNICKITRRPGGVDANDDPNQGFTVSLKAQNNLKRMCYYFRYRERTMRPINIATVTPVVINQYIEHARVEEDHTDPKSPDLTIKGNWTRTIDVIDDYLRECLGTTKIPLAYIVRENVIPPDHNDDPEGNYTNYTEELIARAPHYVPGTQNFCEAYKTDNALVYNKLATLFREKDCWTYMQQATRRRDGRAAYLGLKNHYLGPNNVDNLANTAERQLKASSYTGEGRRWNFEKYVKVHVDQHQILTDLVRHGYAGIDQRSKVRHLLDGIKTKELDTVKTRILSDANLRGDFDACVTLFQDFLKQNQTEPRQSNIPAIGRGPGGPRSESNAEYQKLEPDMSVEDRYYTRDEYMKLSRAKKKALSLKRKKRGHKPGEKSSKTVAKGKKTYSKRTISAVQTNMKNMQIDSDSSESDSDCEMVDAKTTKCSNRSNKALTRKE